MSNPELTLRRDVHADDVSLVERLTAAAPQFRPNEVGVAVDVIRERLERGQESGYHFLFAETPDSCEGYACYGPIPCSVHGFDLYWIVTDPARRRAGVGRRLMQEAERDILARGGRHVWVDTSSRSDYAGTRAFYEALGYRVVAVLNDFYADDDAKVVYEKTLDA